MYFALKRSPVGRPRRDGRIVEPLFVILALMCLPVLLFGNWFVDAYGSGKAVAANPGAETSSYGTGEDAASSPDSDGGDISDEDADEFSDEDADGDAGEFSNEDTGEFSEDELAADDLASEDMPDEGDDGHDQYAGGLDVEDDLNLPETVLAESQDPAATDVQPNDIASDLDPAPADPDPLAWPAVESLPVTPEAEADPVVSEPASVDPLADVLGNDSPTAVDPGAVDPDLAVDPGAAVDPGVADTNPGATDLDLTTLLDGSDPPAPLQPVTRIWTRTDGRTARAVFVRVEQIDNATVVTISPPDNEREFKLPLSVLSPADLEYVNEMQKALSAE